MRAEKIQIRETVQALLGESTGAFLMTYKGMKVSQFSKLRRQLADVGAQCHVIPNRILRKAAKEAGLTKLADAKVAGETALVSGGKDPAQIAKILKDFSKDTPVFSFKLGMLSGSVYSAEETKALADLPPREVLLAQLLGVFNAPAQGLASVLNAKAASILHVLKAYADKKEKAA